jgi:hypothetical protein
MQLSQCKCQTCSSGTRIDSCKQPQGSIKHSSKHAGPMHSKLYQALVEYLKAAAWIVWGLVHFSHPPRLTRCIGTAARHGCMFCQCLGTAEVGWGTKSAVSRFETLNPFEGCSRTVPQVTVGKQSAASESCVGWQVHTNTRFGPKTDTMLIDLHMSIVG